MSNEELSKRDRVRGRLLEAMPKGCVVAEIGVWEGDFSQRILDICAPKELHLIDPWLYMPEFGNTGFGKKKNEHLMEARYHKVVERFANDPRVKVHRALSDVALSSFPDAFLDWVYIDGNHNDPIIGSDLALSLLKVKPNGIIAGDDFNWMSDAQAAPVKRAVEAMLATLGSQASIRLLANQYIVSLKRA